MNTAAATTTADTVEALACHLERLTETCADLAVYAGRADLYATIIDLRHRVPADTTTGRLVQAEHADYELTAIAGTVSRTLWGH